MVRLSAREARNRFAETMNRVAFGGERVVVERHGKDLVAVVPLEDLERLEELEELEDARLSELAAAAKAEFEASGEPAVPWEEVRRRAGLG